MKVRHAKRERHGKRGVLILATALAVVATAGGSSIQSSAASPTLVASSRSALAAATAALKDDIKVSAGIGPTEKLTRVPPKGKVIYWLVGNVSQLEEQTPYIEAAATALGWHVKVLTYTFGDAEALDAAISQAVAAKPAFIGGVAISLSTAGTGVAQAKAAGIPFYVVAGTDPALAKANGVYAEAVGVQWETRAFTALLDYSVIAAGGPTGVLLVGYSNEDQQSYPVAKRAFLSVCSSCDYEQYLATPADGTSGAVPGEVVSMIQRHPAIRYIMLPLPQFYASIRQALDAAGMSKVQFLMVGQVPGQIPNFTAMVPFPFGSTSWAIVDAMARQSIGQSFDRAAYDTLPFPLWTQKVRPVPLPVNYQGPDGYQKAFEKLWGV
jgi:hypothetical protein